MVKIIEGWFAMAAVGARADDVTRLLATDGTLLMQGYLDPCSKQE